MRAGLRFDPPVSCLSVGSRAGTHRAGSHCSRNRASVRSGSGEVGAPVVQAYGSQNISICSSSRWVDLVPETRRLKIRYVDRQGPPCCILVCSTCRARSAAGFDHGRDLRAFRPLRGARAGGVPPDRRWRCVRLYRAPDPPAEGSQVRPRFAPCRSRQNRPTARGIAPQTAASPPAAIEQETPHHPATH